MFGCSKSGKEQIPQAAETPSSEFDKVLVTLKIKDDTALFILLAEDGTVNRMGDGSASTEKHDMFIGINREPLFGRFMVRVTPEMLMQQGAYEVPHREGAKCELTLLLGYRGSEKVAGFKFIYGAESQGPPREIADLVRYAVELTTPWHEEQKRAAKLENKNVGNHLQRYPWSIMNLRYKLKNTHGLGQ